MTANVMSDVDEADEAAAERAFISPKLTSEQIEGIVAAHRLKPIFTLKVLVLYGVWAGLGWAMLTYPYWWVRIPGYLVIGTLVFPGLGLMMHEGTHGLLFASRFWNRVASQIIGITIGVGFVQFRHQHLYHHRETMTDNDRDWALYLWNIPYTVLNGGQALFRSTLAGMLRATPKQRRWFIFETAVTYLLVLMLLVYVIFTGHGWELLHVFGIPFLIFPPCLVARLLLEHYECTADDDYTMSHTITTNRFVSFFLSDASYHTIHHFWPNIPWYNLRKAHYLIEDNLVANGALISHGYLRVLWRGIRTYGLQRPPYWNFPPADDVFRAKRRPALKASAAAAAPEPA